MDNLSHSANSDSYPHISGTISPETARELANELETLLSYSHPSIAAVKDILNRTGQVGSFKYNPASWGDDEEYALHFAGRVVLKQLEAVATQKIFVINGISRRILHVIGRRINRYTKEKELLCAFLMGEKIGTDQEKWAPMADNDKDWLPWDEVFKAVPGLVDDIAP